MQVKEATSSAQPAHPRAHPRVGTLWAHDARRTTRLPLAPRPVVPLEGYVGATWHAMRCCGCVQQAASGAQRAPRAAQPGGQSPGGSWALARRAGVHGAAVRARWLLALRWASGLAPRVGWCHGAP